MNFKKGDILTIISEGGRKYKLFLNDDDKNFIDNHGLEIKTIEEAIFKKYKKFIFDGNSFVFADDNVKIINSSKPVVNKEIKDLIKDISENKPKDLLISDRKWSMLIRHILRAKNVMMVGATGTAKTTTVYKIAEAMGRPFFKFPLGASQDPRTMLIGITTFVEGEGTKFIPSEFVKAIQTPNAVILLDEFTRINFEAENILFTVLDHQRYLRIDENGGEVINVAKGVSFIATANIGTMYTATRVLDRASTGRFQFIEMPFLDVHEEFTLLQSKFPYAEPDDLNALVKITYKIRQDYLRDGEVYGGDFISTREAEEIASTLEDGFELIDILEESILPLYSNEGDGVSSPRLNLRSLIDSEVKAKKRPRNGGSRPRNGNTGLDPNNSFANIPQI